MCVFPKYQIRTNKNWLINFVYFLNKVRSLLKNAVWLSIIKSWLNMILLKNINMNKNIDNFSLNISVMS